MLCGIRFLVAFAIFLAGPGINGHGRSAAQDDAAWKERFLAEAPPAWEKYRARAKRFQGSLERTTVRLAPSRQVMDRNRCEIKQGDGCALFLAQGLGSGSPPDNVGLAMGINGQYGFELRRQTPTAPWAASQVVVDARDGMKFGFGTHPSEGVVYWSTCPTTFAMIPYADGVGIQDFTLKRVTSITRNDRQGVKVEFDFRSPTDKPRIPSIEGWVLYDPQRFWVIREYDVHLEWASAGVKTSMVVTYEYEEAADGFPIPKRVSSRYKKPAEGSDFEIRREFDLKEADVPASDFTLSAFGLPEPGGVRRPTPWYLWAAVLGIVCLSVAALLRWRSRRGTGRGEPTPQGG